MPAQRHLQQDQNVLVANPVRLHGDDRGVIPPRDPLHLAALQRQHVGAAAVIARDQFQLGVKHTA